MNALHVLAFGDYVKFDGRRFMVLRTGYGPNGQWVDLVVGNSTLACRSVTEVVYDPD